MSVNEDALAIKQIQERFHTLQQLLANIQHIRSASEHGIATLQKFSETQKEINSAQSAAKLKSLYNNAIKQAQDEEDVIREALNKISEIRNIRIERIRYHANTKETYKSRNTMRMLLNSAEILPLFVGKVGEKPPQLCGAMPPLSNYIAKVGDMVVVYVYINDEVKENWILAEVINFKTDKNEYEVQDIFTEPNEKIKYTLKKNSVIPLPLMRANPETDPSALFPKGTLVMALYPTTTCFYKALVTKPPRTHTDMYELKFEDKQCEGGYEAPLYVAQRYVIPYKEKP